MAQTSTVKGSCLSSSTLVDLHGPGINKFWRKTSVDTNIRQVVDSNVSAIYGDLFNGTGESCMSMSTAKPAVIYLNNTGAHKQFFARTKG